MVEETCRVSFSFRRHYKCTISKIIMFCITRKFQQTRYQHNKVKDICTRFISLNTMFQSDGLHPNTEGLTQNHQELKIRAKVSGFESQVNKNFIHHIVFLGLIQKLMYRTPCSKPHYAFQQTSTTRD